MALVSVADTIAMDPGMGLESYPSRSPHLANPKGPVVQRFFCSLVMTCLLSVTANADRGPEAQHDWPQWRGPLGTGVAPGAQPPVEWSETKNIRWKTAVPGKGHSTPIIWGERVFLTTAIPYGEAVKPRFPSRPGAHDNLAMTHHHEFAVLAISRKSGKILWQQTVHKELPHEAGHVSASLASASPVTDGERVFAFFGSRGLYCLDTEGKLLWKKHLGEMHTKHGHGEGSSPALHGETLIINWDHEEQSFLVALDKRTGTQRWRVARAEDTSWATPIVVEHAGKAQVIVSGTNRLRGYDLASGAVIWECGGLSSNIVASPVASDGVVYAGSSYDTRALLAIRLDGAKGDITGTKQSRLEPSAGYALRADAAALRRLPLHATALPGNHFTPGCQDGG
jgi:outer membrane protein assembly factor BamB